MNGAVEVISTKRNLDKMIYNIPTLSKEMAQTSQAAISTAVCTAVSGSAYLIDVDGTITQPNPGSTGIGFPVDADALQEVALETVLDSETATRFREITSNVADTGEPDSISYSLDGTDAYTARFVALEDGSNRVLALVQETEHVSPEGCELIHTDSQVPDKHRNLTLESVIEMLEGAVYRADPETFVRSYVSSTIEDIYGVSPTTLIDDANSWEEYIRRDDREVVLETLEESRKKGEGGRIEYRLQMDEGETRWVQDTFEWVTDSKGTVTDLIGVITDITAHKEQETQFQQEKQKFETLTTTIPDAVYRADPETLESQFVTETIEDIHGYSAEEWIQNPDLWEESVHPADRDAVFETFQEALDNHEPGEVEYRFLSRYGDVRWIRDRFDWERDSDGNVTALVGLMRDVTDIKTQAEELRDTKNRLELALSATDTGIWEWNLDTDEVSWSDSLEDLVGLEHGTFEGTFEAFSEMTHPDDLPRVQEAVQEAIETGSFYRTDIRIQHADGEFLWVETRGRLLEDTESERMIGILTDVTDRKQHETDLKQREEQYRELVERLPEAYYTVDDEWTLTFCNDVLCDRIDRSSGELIGKELWDVFPDLEDTVVDESFQEVLETNEPVSYEYYYENMDYWVEIQAYPFRNGIAVISTDITQQKQKLYSVLEFAPLILFEIDPDGVIQKSLGKGLSKLGLEPGELEGVSVYDMYEDHPDIIEGVEMALSGEEFRHTFELGGTILETQYNPIVEDGEVMGTIGVSMDVTELETYRQQLEESNERLEQFAYIASHDLQEPLRTVSNFVSLIAEEYGDDLPDEADRYIDTVTTGCDRMQSMINGLLDYSRVTTRGAEFTTMDTNTAVDDVRSDLEYMLDDRDGTLEAEDGLPTIQADSEQLRQLFQNLAKNAMEHAEEPVNIQIRGSEQPDRYRFEVEDDGPGIEPNRQEKIFRMFKSGVQYQTSEQAKGIGLAICENIVQRHGGSIWVESEPGDGSTFVFTIEKALVEKQESDSQ